MDDKKKHHQLFNLNELNGTELELVSLWEKLNILHMCLEYIYSQSLKELGADTWFPSWF